MRLAKFLAANGVASRRASEELIRAGRVEVGGQVVDDPARDVGPEDAIAVDGRPLGPPGDRVVYALHKPAGVVSTASDPQGRPTVVSLIASGTRLYPVGRLDIDTTGLILLTNDGALAHRLTHPRFEVPKIYRARLENPPVSRRALAALRRGVTLDDGLTAPAAVRRLGEDTIELTLREGRKRQVKRMCEAVGHPVRRLARVGFGPLGLGELKAGQYRRLTEAEVAALAAAGRRSERGASPDSPRRD